MNKIHNTDRQTHKGTELNFERSKKHNSYNIKHDGKRRQVILTLMKMIKRIANFNRCASSALHNSKASNCVIMSDNEAPHIGHKSITLLQSKDGE